MLQTYLPGAYYTTPNRMMCNWQLKVLKLFPAPVKTIYIEKLICLKLISFRALQ